MGHPSTRLGHKKSRNGCLKCKARHVKCDEQRPCRNCVRFGVACSLVEQSPRSPQTPKTPESQNATVVSTPNSPSEGGTLMMGQASSVPHSQHPHPSWLESMRLLHHYDTVVSRILSNEPNMVDLWRLQVPQAAFGHEFLMHGLLALSALHYGQSHPDQREKYILISSHYQSLALQVYTASLGSITEDNFEPYFFLGSFIFIISMCSIADPEHFGSTITPRDIGQSFILLQGIKSICEVKPIDSWSSEGPLAAFKEPAESIPASNPIGEFQDRMEELYQLARRLSPTLDAIDARSSCLLAVESLRTAHASSLADLPPAARARCIWLWPMSLTPLFIELICDNHYMALIILAYYAALIRPFEHPKWMNRGWSDRTMGTIEAHLGREWHGWIEWPKQVLASGVSVDGIDSSPKEYCTK